MSILCYHSVQPRWASPLAVEPADFAQHCAWLAHRRRVLPLRDALAQLNRSGRLPRGMVGLTFDDGFAALHEHAMPVLACHRIPATVFLVAQTLTPAGQPVDWVDTPGVEPLTTLTRDQILEMQDAGVDFQSHSYAHRDLTRLGFDECVTDLRDSREFLSELLGRPVTLLAYPRGRHDERVRQAAERAGYTHAFTLPEQAEQPGQYAIPRVGIYRGNGTRTVQIKASRPYLAVCTDSRYRYIEQTMKRARRLPLRTGLVTKSH